MEYSDIVIIILLSSVILIWIMSIYIKSDQETVIYRYKSDLDLQFDPENFPSIVYEPMFNGNNVWLGGYNSGMNTASRVTVKRGG